MSQGYLAIVLHAHLPFVRHPEHDRFLEENWLFEAITETYIPLIQVSTKFRVGVGTRLLPVATVDQKDSQFQLGSTSASSAAARAD